MKSLPLLIFLYILYIPALYSQDKHDFTWILGYRPYVPNSTFGGSYITFHNGKLESYHYDIPVTMDSGTAVSDEDGNLQIYSNGCKIINGQHEEVFNGDELSPGFAHNYYCKEEEWQAYLLYQGLLALPFPDEPTRYMLFHGGRELNYPLMNLHATLVDMRLQGGQGEAFQKNRLLVQDTLSLTFTAVKHANGRDWWIVAPVLQKNMFYLFRLDPQGIHGPYIRDMGGAWLGPDSEGMAITFSPDGSRFVRMGEKKPAAFQLWDFDRCSGEFSNLRVITLPDTQTYAAWPAFAPGSRYLYISNEASKLYQFDTHVPDVAASIQLVGAYDGFRDDLNLSTAFFSMLPAPDGKIYLSCPNSVVYLHTIHNPDGPGTRCDFRQHDIQLSSRYVFYLPNMPNYRLYQERGSPCDTLGVRPPTVAYWRSEPDTMPGSGTVWFRDLSHYEPTAWYWTFGDGQSSNQTNPVHTYREAGTYEVCLVVQSANGADTLCREITIQQVDGMGPGPDSATFVLYPNPADQRLVFYSLQPPPLSFVELYNALGQKALHLPLAWTDQEAIIPVADLPAGMYFWRVAAPGGAVLGSGKVIIRHR